MSVHTLFRHPHLTRGVVHTTGGNFVIERGLVRAPDSVGAEQGWQRVGSDTSDVVQTAMTQGSLDANGDRLWNSAEILRGSAVDRASY
jgi:hypothetical protein